MSKTAKAISLMIPSEYSDSEKNPRAIIFSMPAAFRNPPIS